MASGTLVEITKGAYPGSPTYAFPDARTSVQSVF